MYLHEKLEEYEKNGRYPMHMPGHKRNLWEEPYVRDITEIEGFDNLHHSEEILKSDREKAAAFYGAAEARFLVNGSTCGVLAAISAVTDYGDHIIIGRNSHKSAYHAVFLRGLRAKYVYSDASLYREWSIDGPIPPEEVRALLEQMKKQGQKTAVFLTSPTYEGVISDIKEIADICHAYGVPLIVDEAHGAHLKVMETYGSQNRPDREGVRCDGVDNEFTKPAMAGEKKNGKFKGDALDAGADIVILGLHKTMPVLTQAALLTVSRDAIREGRVSMKILDDYLGIYETSSPSYVLMGSISRCIHWLDGSGEIGGRKVRETVRAYEELLRKTRDRLKRLKCLRLFDVDEEDAANTESFMNAEEEKKIFDRNKSREGCGHFLILPQMKNDRHRFICDPGKIVLSTKHTGMTGQKLAGMLRDEYDIEIEMASADYIIAMTSMFDSEEGMKKFADAVCACDERIKRNADGTRKYDEKIKSYTDESCECDERIIRYADEFPKARIGMPIAEAMSLAKKFPERVKEKNITFWVNREEGEERNKKQNEKRNKKQGEEWNEKQGKEWNEKQGEENRVNACGSESPKEKEDAEISTEYIYVYPPGIPIIAPGEIITKGVAKKIISDYNSGCALIGCEVRDGSIIVHVMTPESKAEVRKSL